MTGWNGVQLEGLVLHSGRLTLRPWQPSDAGAVREVLADERMHRYLVLPHPYTAQDAIDFVTDHSQAGREAGTRLDCAVAENVGGRVVGAATLQLPVPGRVGGEIGYWIAVPSWGRGYATEATRTLAAFGFAQGLARIQISCAPGNVASAGAALRAGFSYESIARAVRGGHDGRALDAAVFARTATDPQQAVSSALPRLRQISDGVVTLRPVQPQDWSLVLAEATNEVALAWGFGGAPMTEAVAVTYSERAELTWLIGGQASIAICDAGTGAGAGLLTLRRNGPPEVVAIGYGVLPEFRGRAFTTRALRLVSDWAFSQTPIVRLELGCKVANLASARSAENAGFVRDARYASRLKNPDGSYSDEIGFGKVRPGG